VRDVVSYEAQTFCVELSGSQDELGGISTRSGQRGVLMLRNICLLQGEFEMKPSSLLVDGKMTRRRNHSPRLVDKKEKPLSRGKLVGPKGEEGPIVLVLGLGL